MGRKSVAGEPQDSSGLSLLTEREREVFILFADGETREDIAKKLNIAMNTVYAYYARIGLKLRENNLARWAKLAIRKGWVKV